VHVVNAVEPVIGVREILYWKWARSHPGTKYEVACAARLQNRDMFGVLRSKFFYLVMRRWERSEGLRLASLSVGGFWDFSCGGSFSSVAIRSLIAFKRGEPGRRRAR
jgi:hypothetical protein